jgi:uncharacterized Zn-binding protein involved in type VI secretion
MRTAFAALLFLLPAVAPAAPAARVGDPTTHGGVVGIGSPNVVIGGRPAAQVGDFASCPLSTPTNPPLPHVGGPVSTGSPTVFVNGRPAARAGDVIVEQNGGVSAIAAGAPTVLIGSGVAP